ncbi:SGNH hydrolase domain-containing protein [Boseongicola aestuarii]|uniref:SGNH domain-containing protein n=1 Tax=Boseongicola aestuarii TaxID=1470561 RepID=A0A238IVH0_9RHOB|nr:SGNH hydrolase domain-containing protein [Boseongicola aestuarii]SMX22479.1 hypothetical protein BOA8489_00576 [Boseongicola aestuarii]
MLETIGAADVIVLVSNWKAAAAPFVVETIMRIKELSSASVVLVGPKQFGVVDIRVLLQMSIYERVANRHMTDIEILLLNKRLKTIEQTIYLDIIGALCDNDGNCPQVTEGGRLISQDGGHLTPAGALLLGDRLEQKMDLSKIFGLATN